MLFINPNNVIEGIRHIVGYTNTQFPNPGQSQEREAAIDRRIYRLVTEALRLNKGFLDLSRAHEKYYYVINRAFIKHPNEVEIKCCYHMEACPGNNNHSGLLEPFYIRALSKMMN